MSSTLELFVHTQRYMREIAAERLRAEGFSSYKGQDIHWYRLVNNEVVQAIYLITRGSHLYSGFEFRYGCTPLYIPPIFQKSPHMYGDPYYEQMDNHAPVQISGSNEVEYRRLFLLKKGSCFRPYRYPDIMLCCPDDKDYGRKLLDWILAAMEPIQNPRDCFEMHKRRRAEEIKTLNHSFLTPYFIDEVLFWNEQDLFPFCQQFINQQKSFGAYVEKEGIHVGKNYIKNVLEPCLILDNVLREGTREEYLQTFPQREQKTLRLLKKNCNIP